MSRSVDDRWDIMFPGCLSVHPSRHEGYFVLTVSHRKACHTSLVMVPAVSWNYVVVHATLNFHLDIQLTFFLVLTAKSEFVFFLQFNVQVISAAI